MGVQRRVIKIKIEDLDLSVRSKNCLKRAGVNTFRDLINKPEHELKNIRNIGRKSVEKIKAKIQEVKNNEDMEYHYNNILGQIHNLRDYADLKVKCISINKDFYIKMKDRVKKNQKYYPSLTDYPDKFAGYDIVVNPEQNIDYIVLSTPKEECMQDLYYVRNK